MNLLSFDIEISDVFELGKREDMGKYAPFHISVAATTSERSRNSASCVHLLRHRER